MTTTRPSLFSLAAIDASHYRLFVVSKYIALLAIFVHLGFIPLFLWLEVIPLVYFNILSVIAWVVAYFLNLRGRHRLSIVIGVSEVVLHSVLSVYYLTWDSGAHYYLLPLVPFLYFNARQSTPGIVMESLLVFALYITMYLKFQLPPAGILIDANVLSVLNYLNIAVNFAALAIIGYYYRMASHEAELNMRKLATTDSLTGLFNRRRMLEILDQIEAEESASSWFVVLTDIDHFKRFNDRWGHDCGDEVLRQVSRLLSDGVGEADHVARWGGEEFLLLVNSPDLAQCTEQMDVIRQDLANEPFQFDDQHMNVTLTFGVCALAEGQSFDESISQADAALYRGKQAGRNRVVS